jgi:N-acetylneuraminic acid mutarotase
MRKQRKIACYSLGLAMAAITTLTILGLGSVAPALAQITTLSWSYTGSLGIARERHTATLLPNGKVLVIGGRNSARTFNTAELYDPDSGTWRLTGNSHVPRHFFTATLLANGKVLVAGGYAGGAGPGFGITDSAELYDPDTETWSFTSNMSNTRAWHTATLLQNGKVLVAGGAANGNVDITNTAELYDPNTETWSLSGSLSGARYGQTATLLQDGRVLVAGGTDDGDLASTLASAELYDPATGTWKSTGSLGTNRIFHTATLLLSGKVLIAGGYTWPPTSLNTAELYDVATETWTYVGTLNGARNDHTATLLPNGQVLVDGGADWGQGSCLPACQARALSSAELYDPLTATWSNTVNLNVRRAAHTATLLRNGKVLIAGGSANNTTLNSAELYDPNAPISTPKIISASVAGKSLVVVGENFDDGAVIVLNGEEQRTKNDEQNPKTTLIGRKVGKKIKPGDKLQVRNPNGTISEEFVFTGL